MTERLWAPWRMVYILGEKPGSCFFCDLPKEHQDEGNLILYRGRFCFVIINRYPYNNGHLMVAPYRHLAAVEELTGEETSELMALAQRSVVVCKQAIGAHGFNLGMNLGKVAGAGVDNHVHLHIVPRWQGDTNFMPVVTDTKVISEALQQTYHKLKVFFEQNR